MTRYYVKQGPFDHIEGPYGIEQLRYRMLAGLLGEDAVAVTARGQSLGQLRAATDWNAVETVIASHPAEETGSAPEELPLPGASVPFTTAGRQRAVMWMLFGAGLVLLFFADVIANTLAPLYAPKVSFGPIAGWATEPITKFSLTLSVVGMLLFLAGLVERVLLFCSSRTAGS